MKNTRKHNKGFIFLLTITAALGGLLFGFDTAVISGTIGFVKRQYNMDAFMEGWYVSSALLGCIIGVALTGKLGSATGRRFTMVISALLFVASVVGCTFTTSMSMLVVYRLVGGMGIGISSVVCPMYLSEVSPGRLRGKLVTYYQLALTIGILAAYFTNAFVQQWSQQNNLNGWLRFIVVEETWRGMFAMGVLPSVLFLLMTLLIPESPRWLALKNRPEEARAVLIRIQGPENAALEITAIQEALREGTKPKLSELFSRRLRKPVLIGVSLAALSQFSGINAIIYYGPSLLEKAGFRLGDALGGQVTIGIVNTVFTLIAIYYIDRAGRKPLLAWGIGGAVIALLATSLLFAMHTSTGWLVLVPIVLFIACFAFSFGPVTWVVISEIFPTRIRSEAVALSTMSLWVANWIVGQFFPVLQNSAGPSVTFLVFALFSCYAYYLAVKKIPETKGKTLEEISDIWR